MAPDGADVGVLDPAGTDVPDDVDPDRIAAVLRDAGARPTIGTTEALAGSGFAALVAAGEVALRTAAAAGLDAPILPVAVDPGVRSVAVDDLGAAVEQVVSGHATTERHPALSVGVDGEHLGVAVREATLLTAEPARISEFAIGSDATGPVDAVRADGVVVATPAGSRGYAAAGDGPLLAPGTGLSVVPVAPFRIDRTRWVLPVADVTVDVRRDETAVQVAVDGTETTTVGSERTVRIGIERTVETLVVPESGTTFP